MKRATWRIPSSGLWRRVALERTEVSEERDPCMIRVTRIGELGTTLAVISNWSKLRRNSGNVVPSSPIIVTVIMKEIRSSKTSVLIRATRRHIPEDGIPHSYRRGKLKSYIIFIYIAISKACFKKLLLFRKNYRTVHIFIYVFKLCPLWGCGCYLSVNSWCLWLYTLFWVNTRYFEFLILWHIVIYRWLCAVLFLGGVSENIF
jgi:hypothetical protein